MKIKEWALCVPLALAVFGTSAAQAGVSAMAMLDIREFEVKDTTGTVLDISDFDSLVWTGAADEDVFLDPDEDGLEDGNTTTGVNFPAICVGDCPQIANDDYPLISGAPSANYSTADQREVDAPVTNLGSFGSPAFVSNAAYSAIATGDGGEGGSANSNNGLSAVFVLNRSTALRFDGLVRAYAEAFVATGEIFPAKASAATTFSLTITNLSNGQIVYDASPDILNQSVAANANAYPFDLWLTGLHSKGVVSEVPLSALPDTPVLQDGVPYQLSARNNVNVDVDRVEIPEFLGCRLTGGGVSSTTLEDGEIIYLWDGSLVEGPDDSENRYQLGGQAGANTSGIINGQPKAEWQHHQQSGPAGKFSFHAGTASAPAGTEVIEIRCSDPGGCFPSGNPPSPVKQLDFDCIGTFRNIGKGGNAPGWRIANANVTAEGNGNKDFDGTFHYCEVNVDDNGEGPDPADPDSADCPPEGFGEKGSEPLANCDCPDFYRITIYDGVNAEDVIWLDENNIDPASLNQTDIIYEVDGYLGRGGNGLQLHDLTGFDKK